MRPEHRRKISESNKGKIHTPETCRKISEALKGNAPWNKGKKGQSPWNKGKKLEPLSAETRSKMSEAHKGEKNHFYGKKHSLETRLKMSSPHKQTAHQAFLALPKAMALRDKRRIMIKKFSGLVDRSTVYLWIREWANTS